MENPYRSPQAAVSTREQRSDSLGDVATGQKLVIYAIALNIVGLALRAGSPSLTILVLAACLVMSWIGIYRLARGLEYPTWARIGLMLLMLVPLLGLLVMVMLSSRATTRLRKAGYSVGLMGARDY
ncbi:MAG TPA: hypothetical protein VGD42_11045 [Lysobacter sp.]